MNRLKLNTFSTFEHTEQEATAAAILTQLQKEYLRNLMAEAAELRIRLVYTPASAQEFLQQEAYYKSRIEILQYLLDNSEASEEIVAGNTPTEV